MNKERLLKLANFLDDVDPEHFEYRWWVSQHGPHDEEDNRVYISSVPPYLKSCNTCACALGWATAIPELNLVLRAIPRTQLGLADWYIDSTEKPFSGDLGWLPLNASALHAASVAFDIPVWDAGAIFIEARDYIRREDDPEGDGDNVTPRSIASLIRRYVDTEGSAVRRMRSRR